MVDRDFAKQIRGYGLTTAEILYRLPDHPTLLQTYIWQDYDLHPRFPALKKFLEFWSVNLEGPLFQVRVGHCNLLKPAEFAYVDGTFQLH